MAHAGPEGDRRRFLSELRALREESGLSANDVADRLRWQESRIAQIEHGDTPVSRAELVELLDAYGVRDPARVESLVDLARAAAERIWWAKYKFLPENYVELISAETDASRITHYHPIFIPGLLQTLAYADAITATTILKEASADMMDALVEARMQRQRDILGDQRTVDVCALVEENALYRRVGTAAAMREQLDHLTEFIDHDKVKLAVIPRTIDPHPGLLGAFMVLQYDDPEDEPVVCFDGQQGNVVVRSEPGLANAFLNLSRQLLEVGFTGDSARAAIRAAHDTYA